MAAAMCARRRHAFTLTELVIVIAVLSLLTAILLPAVRLARQAGFQVQCAGRLRAIGQAFHSYTLDNDGHMPTCRASGVSSSNWLFWQGGRDINQSALASYLGLKGNDLRQAFRCPAAPPENQLGFQGGAKYPLTFSMNGFLGTAYPSMTFQQVRNPARKIIVYDENENADDDIFWYKTDRDTLAGRHGTRSSQVADINGYGTKTVNRQMGNVLYFDGHTDLADNQACHTPDYNDPNVP